MSDTKGRRKAAKKDRGAGWREYLGFAIFMGIPAAIYLLTGGGAESFFRGP